MSNATLSLGPDAVLRLRWEGIPDGLQMEQAKAVPGATAVQGGWEWGWWSETARRLITEVNALQPSAGLLALLGLTAQRPSPPLFGDEGWTYVDPCRVEQTEWRSTTPPRPHQLAFKAWRRGGAGDGLHRHACLLNAGLGCGKTLSAIEEILELLTHQPRSKVLVLARNALLETVWAEQIEQHAAGLGYLLLGGTRVDRLRQLDDIDHAHRHARVFVHSHEDLPAMGKRLAAQHWDMMVIDETSRFRTAGARRTGRLTGYQARPLTARYRLGLTGLPMIKKATDLYPILRWLGAPTGPKQAFVERFLRVTNPYRPHELELADAEGLRSLLDAWSFVVPKNTVLQIPRSWHYERIQLLPWQRQLYRKVVRDLRRQDAEALASNRLEEFLRLAQVTAGFDGDGIYRENAKLNHLAREILPELDEEPTIVWTRFRQEPLAVAASLRLEGLGAVAYSGAQAPEQNNDAYRDFTGGHCQFFVATLAKGAIGLNLPMAPNMVHLTRDFDTELVWQSLDRNYRLTTQANHLSVWVIEAIDSIDDKIRQVLGDDAHEAARLTTLDVKEVLGL